MGSYKQQTDEVTVSAALENFEDIDSLREELETWKSGMEGTGLENTQKYETLGTSVDTLQSAYDTIQTASGNIELPDELSDKKIKVTYTKPYGRDPMTRAQRLGYCTAMLMGAVEALRDEKPTKDCEECTEGRIDCPDCAGRGETSESGRGSDGPTKCERCDGEGKIDCETCNGEGTVEDEDFDISSDLDDIENACGDLDGVEFPSMYG
jgi:hypothetical protein